MRNALICLPLAAALAACSGEAPVAPDDQMGAAANVTTIDAGSATPTPVISATTPVADGSAVLAPYLGKYPHDAVNGVRFFDQPAVKAAVEAAVIDPTIRQWILERAGPQTPIAKIGDHYAAWGCEKSNCGSRNWTVLITPDAKTAQICYKADGAATPSWYEMGVKIARTDPCPSEG